MREIKSIFIKWMLNPLTPPRKLVKIESNEFQISSTERLSKQHQLRVMNLKQILQRTIQATPIVNRLVNY